MKYNWVIDVFSSWWTGYYIVLRDIFGTNMILNKEVAIFEHKEYLMTLTFENKKRKTGV